MTNARTLAVLAIVMAACEERGPDPIVPEVEGECPAFVSGTQTIGPLETTIHAGDGGGALVFYWHGTGGNAGDELLAIPPQQREEILGGGGLIVAPQSNGEERGGFSPNGVWYEGGDFAWVDRIVACAVRDHGIDPRRIYTTGCSAGGLMAGALALGRSEYVAAATPNSGGIVAGGVTQLQDRSRVPAVLTMHGGASDTVRVNFGETSAALLQIIDSAGGFAVDCDHESGHCGADVELRNAAWDFMKAHPFGTVSSPYEDGLPASFPGYCDRR